MEKENVDVRTASLLHLIKRGKMLPDGTKGPTPYEDTNLDDIAFRAGIDARVDSECYGKTPPFKTGPGGLTRNERLAQKADALVRQNPPRRIRPFINL